jgi:hypothetical protein
MSNTAKKARFNENQLKKSVRAGLTRAIKDDEMIVADGFYGTFAQYIKYHYRDLPFSTPVSELLREGRKTAYKCIAIGYAKLESGEELRNYVPQKYQG